MCGVDDGSSDSAVMAAATTMVFWQERRDDVEWQRKGKESVLIFEEKVDKEPKSNLSSGKALRTRFLKLGYFPENFCVRHEQLVGPFHLFVEDCFKRGVAATELQQPNERHRPHARRVKIPAKKQKKQLKLSINKHN